MTFNAVTFGVFLALIIVVTGMGFIATRWRRASDLHQLDEWALGGRGFGGFVTWFLLGGDLYSAYTLIAVPAAIFSIGAFGFYAVPNAVVLYSLGFLFLPKLVRLAHEKGYVTLTDFVNDRFKSPTLGVAITLTGLLATLPYLALQLIGLEVVFSSMGINAGPQASWFIGHLPLFVAFGVLAAYTYSSGIRAPALIAFLKDGLTYVVVIVAVIVIPIKLGGFGNIFADAGAAMAARTNTTDPQAATISVNASVYMTLALGSGMAFFLYPHAITGVFSARGAKTVRRNMSVLPIYTVLLGFVALLGVMALAAGIEPLNGNPQFAVPQLLTEMFPSWFVGVAFAAIAMSALVPAAIMAIGAGNLVSRNIVQQFSRKKTSARRETEISKIVSVLIKVGALVFVLTLDSQFALNFQLLGGIWILQTLPTVLLGLFAARFMNSRALLAGWAVGIVYGTVAAYNVSSANASHFGGSTAAPFFLSSPMYIAISALIINLAVALAWTWVSAQARMFGRPRAAAPTLETIEDPEMRSSATTPAASPDYKESSIP
ncbi:monocarboxylate uptake permease MctP [Mycolicibacterium goodii]|uniref:monocarboxylate uptake permease MctP n=1 Tax=Mycolicibacterium goodii TaxID=134601 RepID=UPI001BDDC8D3|nr:sodium:solute symporter [Mycolicibacterium goodii]MBU8819661.1 sodium:solute symporter [Mycolicibacterium goodii]MBU8833966.1 sodium:solute symporter [Mycolicibacterium goodii]